MFKTKLFVIFFVCSYTATCVKLHRLDDSGNKLMKLGAVFNNQRDKAYNMKSKIVSRILPHGTQTQAYEYNSKLNTIYKPLIRLHIRKPVKNYKDLNQQKGTINLAYIIFINKNHRQNDKKEKKIRNKYLESLLNGGEQYLRTNLIDKTLEDIGEYEPDMGSIGHSDEEELGTTTARPSYPFFNYWTYGKTIHEDDCKGNLIKLGDVCISPYH